jgi:hypothetical protein
MLMEYEAFDKWKDSKPALQLTHLTHVLTNVSEILLIFVSVIPQPASQISNSKVLDWHFTVHVMCTLCVNFSEKVPFLLDYYDLKIYDGPGALAVILKSEQNFKYRFSKQMINTLKEHWNLEHTVCFNSFQGYVRLPMEVYNFSLHFQGIRILWMSSSPLYGSLNLASFHAETTTFDGYGSHFCSVQPWRNTACLSSHQRSGQLKLIFNFYGQDTIIEELGQFCHYGGLYVYYGGRVSSLDNYSHTYDTATDTTSYHRVIHLCTSSLKEQIFEYYIDVGISTNLYVFFYTYVGYSTGSLIISHGPHEVLKAGGLFVQCRALHAICNEHLLFTDESELYRLQTGDYQKYKDSPIYEQCYIVNYIALPVLDNGTHLSGTCDFSISWLFSGPHTMSLKQTTLLGTKEQLSLKVWYKDYQPHQNPEFSMWNHVLSSGHWTFPNVKNINISLIQTNVWAAKVVSLLFAKNIIACSVYSYMHAQIEANPYPLFVTEGNVIVIDIIPTEHCILSFIGPCDVTKGKQICRLAIQSYDSHEVNVKPILSFDLKYKMYAGKGRMSTSQQYISIL